ncbi:hypothetical protein HF086_011762 [Spodoptera exigua]|uniref:Uncharacterized protein n=1 Tax=Spodoptera exigua TaxID=7107 RepID=A0A922MHI4_SPOEX|nr:hypothetical protein HF086_011762 [Spodoptera exigua]
MVVSEEQPPAVEGDAAASKKAAKKAAKAAEKQQKKAEHKAASGQAQPEASEPDVSEGRYGQLKMIQSSGENRDRVYTDVKDLSVKLNGQNVWVRGPRSSEDPREPGHEVRQQSPGPPHSCQPGYIPAGGWSLQAVQRSAH